MDAIQVDKKRSNPVVVIVSVIFLFLFALVAFKIGGPEKHSYAFVSVDHPVDMWAEGSDKWSYFSLGTSKTKATADLARKELLAMGFIEDTTMGPWFRFVKVKQEVIVCNHHEFGVNRTVTGSKLVKPSWSKGTLPPTKDWPCVLVKNGPGTETSIQLFAIKKLVRRW